MISSLFAATAGGEQITFDTLDFVKMWETISNGVGSFVSGVVVPLSDFCANNEITLAFLSVTFACLGVRLVRRTVGAFGYGL